jgi:hypothetical protein
MVEKTAAAPRHQQMRVSRSKPETAPAKPEPSPAEVNGLRLVAETIFTDGNYGEFTLKDGKTSVVIQMAKVKHIAIITDFLGDIVNVLGKEEHVAELLAVVVNAQEEAIRLGGSPRKLSTDMIVAAALGMKAGEAMDPKLVTARGGMIGAILVRLLGHAVGSFATHAARFTNLTPEQFEELDIDEGVLVVGAIFMANYSFFTQTLPPVLQAFLAAWAAKQKVR